MSETQQVRPTRTSIAGGSPGQRPNVAILGFTDHRKLAPFHDPTFEVWGLNELYRYMDIKLFTRWFEIHDRAYFEQHDPEHLKALAQLPIPVYMQTAHPDIPPAIPLPKAAIEAAAGKYMTSSIAWMLGLAIMETVEARARGEKGFEKIHVYGVDMAQDTEYREQRPGCEYLIGLARGMGIEVYVPPTSDLMKAVGQYAFGGGDEFSLKIVERMEWLHRERLNCLGRLNQLETEFTQKNAGLRAEYDAKKAEFTRNIHQLEGAIDDNVYWKRSWSVGGSNAGGKGAPHPDRGEPRVEQDDTKAGQSAVVMPDRVQQVQSAMQAA